MARPSSALALALFPFAAALLASGGRIRRGRQMRVSRILPQLAEQLGYACSERRHLLLELRDPRSLDGEICRAGSERGFQLRDSLIPPVLGHEASNRPSAPAWKVKNTHLKITLPYRSPGLPQSL
jgi:hypothetical protein